MIAALLVLALGADPEAAFTKLDEIDGITIESRAYPGSSFAELRFTTTTSRSPQALCDAAYGTGEFDADEPDLAARKILFESENERVTYDHLKPPVVSNRDYAIRAIRMPNADTACRMTFEAANDMAPKELDGWVRVTKLKGSWQFDRIDEKATKLTYVVFTEPGGSVPPFMVMGTRKALGVKWVQRVIRRAKTVRAK